VIFKSGWLRVHNINGADMRGHIYGPWNACVGNIPQAKIPVQVPVFCVGREDRPKRKTRRRLLYYMEHSLLIPFFYYQILNITRTAPYLFFIIFFNFYPVLLHILNVLGGSDTLCA